ncbi:MAG: 50S ribosomal protein L24 [Candidatus Aenigmarchaeota archaeon]|nr:50S ribosomal protein L24 [Candidatus Aenigmarchaeota archaeon]
MKKSWSNEWVSSVQPRKQRKYVHNAPLHVKHRLLSVHLAPVLRERYGTRSVTVRKGDKVKVMRGSSKGFSGPVERISLKKMEVFIEGLKAKKVDGTEVLKSLKPSNIMITELNTDDKTRQSKLLGKEKTPAKPKGGAVKKAGSEAKKAESSKEEKPKESKAPVKKEAAEKKVASPKKSVASKKPAETKVKK